MIETRPYDVQNYLATPEDRAAYLEAALKDGDT
jgi:DNA-binding phage protein